VKFIIGKKLDMSQVWKDDGTVVPVTLISAEPNTVVQVKTQAKDGYSAAQVGALRIKAKSVSQSIKNHFKDLEPKKILREARSALDLARGQVLDLNQFKVGEKVKVSGVSKGKGFAGVVKRHHFAGGPASHGHKDNLRMPGAIGSGGIQRVFKGLKMAGRMGGDQVTVSNLEVVKIDTENNVIALKGAVPGARGSIVVIKSQE
jgi:large subunit ribosomal protein L3